MFQKNIQKNDKRMEWIDLTKVIATFMVLFQHSSSALWTGIQPETYFWKMIHFPFILSRIAVLLFFMCSGSLMLSRERSIGVILKRNVIHLLKVYFFWMVIYGFFEVVSLYKEGLANLRVCINAVVKSILFGQYHTWFIFALISLYLITPFLYYIVQDKKRMEYFLVISFVFTIMIPLLRSLEILQRFSDNLDNFHMYFVYGYILYYVLGYYISQMKWKKQYTIFSFMVFVISYGSSCILTLYDSLRSKAASQEIFGEFSVFAFLTTVSFFGIIRSLENIRFPTILAKINALGFGIYLIHPLFLNYIQSYSDSRIFIVIPLIYVVCIIICGIIAKSKILSFCLLK